MYIGLEHDTFVDILSFLYITLIILKMLFVDYIKLLTCVTVNFYDNVHTSFNKGFISCIPFSVVPIWCLFNAYDPAHLRLVTKIIFSKGPPNVSVIFRVPFQSQYL